MELEARIDGEPKVDGLRFSPRVLKLISSIDEFKGAWRAIGRIAPDRLCALRRIATVESAASSTRIEGAKRTDREDERLLSNLGIQSFITRDEQEVAGYADTWKWSLPTGPTSHLPKTTSASFTAMPSSLDAG